ncbi:MAG: OsmC family protein [Bacteroidia bacterium]|nr:OsmC family protein [Bacteroidia bacterium]
MKIELKRTGDNFAFEAANPEGNKMVIDTSAANGGEGKGFSPMQLLLVGVAGCSGIDIVHILKKQRQEIISFEIEVEGLREKVEEYSIWKEITLHYKLKGKIDKEKAERAASLSHEKYCSVSKIIGHTSKINFTVTVEN